MQYRFKFLKLKINYVENEEKFILSQYIYQGFFLHVFYLFKTRDKCIYLYIYAVLNSFYNYYGINQMLVRRIFNLCII